MEWLLGVGVFIICVLIVEKFVLKKDKAVTKVQEATVKENEKLPYKVNDSLLTDAESSFYHALKLYVGDRAVICPKVGLKDIFFISKKASKDYMKYFGKISQKHVDFILCDPGTMSLLCGIELDDSSHMNRKRQERDLFVEKVYRDANLKLIRIPTKFGYTSTEIETAVAGVLNRPPEDIPKIQSSNDTVMCPKCGIPMVLRKAARGKNAGNEFYGCPNYPKCKEIINKGAPKPILSDIHTNAEKPEEITTWG
ncbi:MAG TPA: topoisomerase [Marinilabiliaceae bacterium]|nr:topoisomerase [Marinilabiliaceae bacterium]